MLKAKTGGGGAAAGGSTVGQAFYGMGNGSYTWTCPTGVTSVCVVCIGGGQASRGSSWSDQSGTGGGLGWKNNITVVPGNTYTVEVGRGGNMRASGNWDGGDSYFIDAATVSGKGGGSSPGGYTGDGGGNGGGQGQYGGGGAGGYSGAGGGPAQDGAGGGGAGGGNYSSTYGGASGGGTGPFGQGASGTQVSYAGGQGGSGGEDGLIGENPWESRGVGCPRTGGLYGGGGGGTGTSADGGPGMNPGGRGCVRIIWGEGRSFPSTKTGDM
jgi:hypothetical protein